MQRGYLIEVDDAVVVTRDQNGRVKLNQLMHPTASGAVAGAFWGMLVGWLFLMPLAGAAVGAAGGQWTPDPDRPTHEWTDGN